MASNSQFNQLVLSKLYEMHVFDKINFTFSLNLETAIELIIGIY